MSDRPTGCWEWVGSVRSNGYGIANLDAGRLRTAAHRAVYEEFVGPIPDGLQLDHSCHNQDLTCVGGDSCRHRRCVNPRHLVPSTPRENVTRGRTIPALNLAKETCPNGHEYDRADPRGWRKCSVCDLARQEAKRRAHGVPESRAGSSHCAHGHEYTESTTRWSRGKRYCKSCDRVRMAARNLVLIKPCRGCGGRKEPGRAYRYCSACRARTTAERAA